MQQTEKYKFNKPELADAPPDITVLNPNFDKMEEVLDEHQQQHDWQNIHNETIWESINMVNEKIDNKALTPFCVNAGALDSNGNPAILGYANDVTETKELAFVQPVLTANGTMGGSAFAVTANQYPEVAYNLFGASTSGWSSTGIPTSGDPAEITIYNPVALKLSAVTIRNGGSSDNVWSEMTLYGSYNGSTWTEINKHSNSIRTANTWVTMAVSPNEYYKYYKFSFTSNTQNTNIVLSKISLKGTYTSTHTGGRVTFRAPFTATTANGKTFMVGSVYDIDVSRSTERKAYVLVNPVGASSFNPGTLYKQETQPATPVSGDLWLKTLEPLSFFFYFADEWHERNDIVIIGEIELDGAGKITKTTTYPYNQNGYTVNAQTMATPTTFGVMRTAAAVDETNCQCDDAAITPENIYKLANFRIVNTAYNVGDIVAVPYHSELRLKCTVAGTTSSDALDVTGIKIGQVKTDGTVNWSVISAKNAYAIHGATRSRDSGKPTYGLT